MNVVELNILKEELVEWIGSLDDADLLNFLNAIKQSKISADKDWWDELTPAQKDNLQAGLEDIDKGNTLSSKSFWGKLTDDA